VGKILVVVVVIIACFSFIMS